MMAPTFCSEATRTDGSNTRFLPLMSPGSLELPVQITLLCCSRDSLPSVVEWPEHLPGMPTTLHLAWYGTISLKAASRFRINPTRSDLLLYVMSRNSLDTLFIVKQSAMFSVTDSFLLLGCSFSPQGFFKSHAREK